jgi:phage FluMu protein Com
MGVDTYDCCLCGDTGIHSDFMNWCSEGHHICDYCKESEKLKIEDDGDYFIIDCPKCIEENKIKILEKCFNKLLEMYNKRRKVKLTRDDLEKLI